MKFKSLLSLAMVLSLALVFQSVIVTGENKPEVEIKLFRTSFSPSGNWMDTSFVIRNNTKKPIRYVQVELAG